jgi:hypothetical protein
MTLKPWREARPSKTCLRGAFQETELAADLSRVHSSTATVEYQDLSFAGAHGKRIRGRAES